jgi:hypothetical protein
MRNAVRLASPTRAAIPAIAKEKIIVMARAYKISPQERRARSERMKQQKTDPEFAAKQAAAARETLERLNADPEFVAKRIAAVKQKHADPVFAAANSERMKQQHANTTFTAKLIAAVKQKHADPVFAAKQAAAASQNMTRLNANPVFAARRDAVTSARRALPVEKREARIGKSNGIFAPVSAGAHPRNPAAWTPQRLGVPLPAPAGQRAGEVRSASPGCSGGAGPGPAGGGRQGRDDGTRKCPGSARTSPMGRRHGSWT